jgi:2-phospho-L-lactate guanylyltransferase (CobY/MobA/RfbA family)
VTSDDSVRQWAVDQRAESLAEPIPGDLNRAAAAAIRAIDGSEPWIVVHADLPAVTAADFAFAKGALDRGTVLAPSHDGGTSLVGGTGHSFPFRYGPASFRLHLAAVRGQATVIVRPGFALDLDRERDVAVFQRLALLG